MEDWDTSPQDIVKNTKEDSLNAMSFGFVVGAFVGTFLGLGMVYIADQKNVEQDKTPTKIEKHETPVQKDIPTYRLDNGMLWQQKTR